MTIKEASQFLGVSETTVRAEIRDRRLPACRIRTKYVIDPADLEAYKDRCRLKPKDEKPETPKRARHPKPTTPTVSRWFPGVEVKKAD